MSDDNNNLHIVIADAAKAAAKVFATQQWKWWDNEFPDEHDIANKFDSMLERLRRKDDETISVRGGRLGVERSSEDGDDQVEYRLVLDLGAWWEVAKVEKAIESSNEDDDDGISPFAKAWREICNEAWRYRRALYAADLEALAAKYDLPLPDDDDWDDWS